jgi:hypothetical protein
VQARAGQTRQLARRVEGDRGLRSSVDADTDTVQVGPRRERIGRDGDRAARAVQHLHRVVAFDDVLATAPVPRADDEQVGAFVPGHVAQGVRRRHAGVDLDDRLGRELVAHRAQVPLEALVQLDIGRRERQRRVVTHADEQQPRARGRSDRVRERYRAAAALAAVAPGDDSAKHEGSPPGVTVEPMSG